MWNAQCKSASERTRAKGKAGWEGLGVGGMSPFSHLSHAQMFGGGEVEDWGWNRGAGRRSKRPPLRES